MSRNTVARVSPSRKVMTRPACSSTYHRPSGAWTAPVMFANARPPIARCSCTAGIALVMVGAGVAVDHGVGAGGRGCGVGVGVGLGVAGGVGLALSGAVAEGVDGDAVASTPVGGVGDGNTNEVTA